MLLVLSFFLKSCLYLVVFLASSSFLTAICSWVSLFSFAFLSLNEYSALVGKSAGAAGGKGCGSETFILPTFKTK